MKRSAENSADDLILWIAEKDYTVGIIAGYTIGVWMLSAYWPDIYHFVRQLF